MKILSTLFLVGAITFGSCTSNGQDTKKTADTVKTEVKTSETKKEAKSQIAEDVNEVKFNELMNSKDNLVLDVRTPQEFNAGHIKNAININVNSTDFMVKLTELESKNKAVLIYCRSGARSARAMKMLNKAGYEEVYNLLGGYMGYSKK